MFIKRIELHRFKQFQNTVINLKPELSLVVGGNNSGKSSILQALATWEFCKTLLEVERGRKAWTLQGSTQGIGMGIVDFTPMNIPSLRHLWTNLNSQKKDEVDGYTLKVKAVWDTSEGVEKFLEVGLSLANDRLFVKATGSNIALHDIQGADGNPISGNIPRVAYLPPFAGITDRESRLTPAMRDRLIGQGLSGGVVRNVLFDMHEANRKSRTELRGDKTKISNADLAKLRETDPWEVLQRALQDLFSIGLEMVPFNERYHSYLRVETFKGEIRNKRFQRFKGYNSRDLMVEGSGFLQWLSVYALALTPEVDIVLLDEPDAHLHCSLQQELASYLARLVGQREKQVLLATHSTELIRALDCSSILRVKDRQASYLSKDDQKIAVLSGIGAIFTPRLHALTKHKCMVIVENESDERLLRILAISAGVEWPLNLVSWYWTGKPKERRQLFLQLRHDIPGLKAISIRDRDDEPDGTVDETLVDKMADTETDGFIVLKWRRRHIENYLLHPAAIARAANKPIVDVNNFFQNKHALSVPADPTLSGVAPAVRDARGKEILLEGEQSVTNIFGLSREDIAKNMRPNEVGEDLMTCFKKLIEMCQ